MKFKFSYFNSSTINSKSSFSILISLILTLIVFFQNPPWFIISISYTLLFSSIFFLFIILLRRFYLKPVYYFDKIWFILVLFLYFGVISSYGDFRVSSIFTILTFIILLSLSEDEKYLALICFTKFFSFIIFISFFTWSIHNLFLEFPSFGIIDLRDLKGAGETILINHLFFLQIDSFQFNRFYSVFDEPGVLGTLGAFILIANNLDFRQKDNLIIFVGCLFSFSLSFYFLIFLAFIFKYSSNIRLLMKFVIIFMFFLFIFFLFLNNNSTFQGVILYRLFNFDEFGIESRTSYDLNLFFNDFLFSKDFLFGKGTSFLNSNPILLTGQGYKFFFIEYGFFGFLLVLCMYFYLMDFKNKYHYFCLFVFLVSFLQRPFMFTSWQLVVFSFCLTGLNVYSKNKKYLYA